LGRNLPQGALELTASGALLTPNLSKQYPYTKSSSNGLLEQWIEYDLAGRVNPYGLCGAKSDIF
jgi:hypothetical protein